ncbi:MAG TPA: peptidoglycan DD-metalloendopeptidase family protein, partial [Gemmatimonadales bacterium]|nr:peptidoglycan DD-metalloendopeptidase family protein [Gemmatimonadales bacterium]
LRHLGADHTALGRDWLTAAERSLATPLQVELPYRELRYFDAARATAVAYRVTLRNGQRLIARTDVAGATRSDIRLFLDLFSLPNPSGRPQRVAHARSESWQLEHVATDDGIYFLRVQPELMRGGRVTLTMSAHASLAFPVPGGSWRQVKSGFGAARDAGARDHAGVDIFAPRGTPVVAAVAGRVTRVRTERTGGKVIWLEETPGGRRLYYAHLDSQLVHRGVRVRQGDTLGWVGNTGNARATPPHLHFAVYSGRTAVDPSYHLQEPAGRPPAVAADPINVGRQARMVTRASLQRQPTDTAAAVGRMEPLTPVEVLAGIRQWYLVRLPDGREGYTRAAGVSALDPLRTAVVVTASALRGFPTAYGFEIDSVGGGQVVAVLGRFGTHLLVRHPRGTLGWIGAAAVGPSRPPASN